MLVLFSIMQMIEQWLNISPSDIVVCSLDSFSCFLLLLWLGTKLKKYWKRYYQHLQVVFSQMGGSNRSGFTILSSNSKGDIHLDGLFNIISYDLVAKLENVLMASEFKVSTIFLHFKFYSIFLCFAFYTYQYVVIVTMNSPCITITKG